MEAFSVKGLFLDLSTRVGAALFRGPSDPTPSFGTKRLKQGGEIGPRTLELRNWLRETLQQHRPAVVGFESPLVMAPSMGGGLTQAHTIRLQIALATEIETTALELGVRHLYEVATMSAKKALTGSGTLGLEWKGKPAADRSKEWKRRMVAEAQARGWEVQDDHQADAGAVGLVCYREMGMPVQWHGEMLAT